MDLMACRRHSLFNSKLTLNTHSCEVAGNSAVRTVLIGRIASNALVLASVVQCHVLQCQDGVLDIILRLEDEPIGGVRQRDIACTGGERS